MVIPTSFLVRCREQEAIVKRVQMRAEPRLRRLCDDNRWLFEGRIKPAESVLAKLQLGELRSIEDMHDFYATTVVVPTRAELEDAVTKVMAAFGEADRKPPRLRDPEAFIYDDAHVIARLGPLGGNLEPAEVEQRAFEVQVRTGLQWAWWRATHDQVYKGSDDWRLRRAAASVRAVLESAEGDLADLQGAAERLGVPAGIEPDADAEAIGLWPSMWPEARRAADPRRFVENVQVYLAAAGLDVTGCGELLKSTRSAELIATRELTPAQTILILLAEECGATFISALRAYGRFVLVTDEMRSASTCFSDLGTDDVVMLDPGSPCRRDAGEPR